jgi:hypothetical protein
LDLWRTSATPARTLGNDRDHDRAVSLLGQLIDAGNDPEILKAAVIESPVLTANSLAIGISKARKIAAKVQSDEHDRRVPSDRKLLEVELASHRLAEDPDLETIARLELQIGASP